MRDARDIKRIPLSRAANSPRLKAPAGYVVVIADVEYGNRFKILRLPKVDRHLLNRATDLPFATKLFLVWSAPNAAALALELHDRFAASREMGDWFDLDDAQVGQMRTFVQRSLRSLALSQGEGQSLVEKSEIVDAAAESPAPPTGMAPKRPQRRWASWLLLLAIMMLGASVVGNAPQLRRLLSGLTSIHSTGSGRNIGAPASQYASPTADARARTAKPSPTAVAGAGEVFYVLARANARVCASKACRADIILDSGNRIVALRYESGQSLNGDKTWIAFRLKGAILYIHRSVLTQDRLAVNLARPSATATFTAVSSATAMPADTLAPTDTATPTGTVEPTNTVEPAATAAPTESREPTATVEPTATATRETHGYRPTCQTSSTLIRPTI